jgi:hypothetical protein
VNRCHRYSRWESGSGVSRKNKEDLSSLTERKSLLLPLTKIDRKNAAGKASLKSGMTPTLDNGAGNTR